MKTGDDAFWTRRDAVLGLSCVLAGVALPQSSRAAYAAEPSFKILHRFKSDPHGPTPAASAWSGVAAVGDQIYAGALYAAASGPCGTVHALGCTQDDATAQWRAGAARHVPRSKRAFLPHAAPVQAADGNLYGTAYDFAPGADADRRPTIIYRMTPDLKYTRLQQLDRQLGGTEHLCLGLCAAPDGGLYGVTQSGGSQGGGMFFRMDTAGDLVELFGFGAADTPRFPTAVPTFDAGDGHLYGTAPEGGRCDGGALYRMSAAGEITLLHSFGSQQARDIGVPAGPFIVHDSGFYGLAVCGLTRTVSIYKVTKDGARIAVLRRFASGNAGEGSSLAMGADGMLYGLITQPSAQVDGIIYRMDTQGHAYRVVHSFHAAAGDIGTPFGELSAAADGWIYGVTRGAMADRAGAVYAVKVG